MAPMESRKYIKNVHRIQMSDTTNELQINLEKDFGYTDDDVVNELKEALSDLGSKRMDTAGRPSDEELPKSPFGLAAQQESPMRRLNYNLALLQPTISAVSIPQNKESIPELIPQK